ncbi:hypothetical protein ACO0LM_24355, partial [Undibacterium sp. Di26W]|uniref:hypothetical protein n=1 Tax=Undibacterium sp. Di26W TaxID=3413035 RepID=UPI003BF2E528
MKTQYSKNTDFDIDKTLLHNQFGQHALRTLHGRRHLPSKKRIMIYRNRLHAYIRPVIATNAAGPYGIR